MQITFEDFSRILDRVKRYLQFEDAIYDSGRRYLKGFDYDFNFPTLINDTIELLEIATNDVEGWISYWAFDLYCGEQGDCTITYNGEEVQLRTVEDLWWLIQRCNSEESDNDGVWVDA